MNRRPNKSDDIIRLWRHYPIWRYLEEGGVVCIFFLSFFLLAVEREIETKGQTFRYRSLLSEQNQNILIWSAYYRNKSRTFQSVPKLFKIELERFGVFKVQKQNQNETKLISYQIEMFPYTYASKETKRNFCELFPNFFTTSECFCLLQAA